MGRSSGVSEQEVRREVERDAVVTAKDERAKPSEADIERLKQRSIERRRRGARWWARER